MTTAAVSSRCDLAAGDGGVAVAGPGRAGPTKWHRRGEPLRPHRDGPVLPVGGVSGPGGVSAVAGGPAPRRHRPALRLPRPHPVQAAAGCSGPGGRSYRALGGDLGSEQEVDSLLLLLLLLQINSRLKQQLKISVDLVVHHWQTDTADGSTQQLLNRCVCVCVACRGRFQSYSIKVWNEFSFCLRIRVECTEVVCGAALPRPLQDGE